jgi:hypothetical protein
MPMLPRAKAFLLLTILGAVPVEAGARAALFARHAVTIADIHGSSRPMTVTAPDDRTRAIARFSQARSPDDDGGLTVFLGGDDHDFAGGPRAELLWAPDSRALAVTADDGGATGRFDLSILVRRKKGRHWRQIDLSKRVAKLFAGEMRCDERETPNVGAVGWTSGQRLIVAAQVPPHSSCANMGHVAAYIVDVKSGDVLMKVDQSALHRRYRRMLGMAFAADAKHHHHHRRHVR